MSLPQLHSYQPTVSRQPKLTPHSAWSFTASTGPRDNDHALVVFRLAVRRLGIDDLRMEVAARSGGVEAVRWQRARVREYVMRLREQLRLHLTSVEIIVHADEGIADDRLQVIATVASGDARETARLEQEIADRVEAIAKRAWITWSEGLSYTMATRRALDGELRPADLSRVSAASDTVFPPG